MDPKADTTAAACRYLLVALMQRLEAKHPGLIGDIRSGVAADRQAMATSGTLTQEAETTVLEALRILELASRP